MLTEGHITIERKFLEWQWHDRPDMASLFLHLLLSANWKDITWHGMTVKRGQLVTSLSNLSLLTGLTIKRVRNCLERLEECDTITCYNWANRFRVITICNYDSYQAKKITKGKPKANNGQTKGRPRAIIEESNNVIKEKGKEKVPSPSSDSYDEYESYCEWVVKQAPHVAAWDSQMNREQWETLRQTYSKTELAEIIMDMENTREAWDKYTNVYTTINRWMKIREQYKR